MFIRRFGPAILFSTERYESFNHVFRLSCIYSNRQAPSRDSCNAFAALDRIKHVATGGYWLDPHTRTWAHAGQSILDFISTHDNYLSWIGLPKENKLKPGGFFIYSFVVNVHHLWRGYKTLTQERGVRTARALYAPPPRSVERHKNISSLGSRLQRSNGNDKLLLSSSGVICCPER
jgi:hypothetical protein